jgi:hypothetical protein
VAGFLLGRPAAGRSRSRRGSSRLVIRNCSSQACTASLGHSRLRQPGGWSAAAADCRPKACCAVSRWKPPVAEQCPGPCNTSLRCSDPVSSCCVTRCTRSITFRGQQIPRRRATRPGEIQSRGVGIIWIRVGGRQKQRRADRVFRTAGSTYAS